MIGALIALMILDAAPPPEPPALDSAGFDARIRDAYAAAQTLQGPLDGAWVLNPRRGRTLYRLQITDPAGGGPLQAAWSVSGTGPKTAGPVGSLSRDGGDLSLTFTGPDGEPAQATLTLGAHGIWRGRLIDGAIAVAVSLRRPN